MKLKIVLFSLILAFVSVTAAQAADVKVKFPINDALSNAKVKNALVQGVDLYWGNLPHPPVSKTFGEFRASKRTNAFGKGREFACQWALATAIKVLQNRALKEGGNAVINIKSMIKDQEMSSDSQFECLAGTMMVNAAIEGTVVKLAK